MRTIKIYVFETSRGVYTNVGGSSEKEARANFPALATATLVGEVPADEYFLTTTQAPSVLYQHEARSIRRGRRSCGEWYQQHGVTLRIP